MHDGFEIIRPHRECGVVGSERVLVPLEALQEIAEIVELAARPRLGQGLIGERVCLVRPAGFERCHAKHHARVEMCGIGSENLTIELRRLREPARLMQALRCPQQRIVHGVVAPARRSDMRGATAGNCSSKKGMWRTANAETSTGMASTL